VLQQDSFSGEGEAFIDLLRDFKHYKNDKYADTILIEIIDQKTVRKQFWNNIQINQNETKNNPRARFVDCFLFPEIGYTPRRAR
jgi:hypothetical protein